MLSGQVPHLSFISPRPVGSAILHIVDDLLPGPLLLESRVLALVEFMAIALLFGVLVFRKAPARWTAIEAAAVAIAFVVGLHTFPLMPWYTTDGILLALAGWTLLMPGRGRIGPREAIGLLLAGASATTKQSFFLVPVIAVILAALPAGPSSQYRLARGMAAAAIVATPGLTLLVSLGLLGAWPAMRTQLLDAGGIDWLSSFEPLPLTLPLTSVLVLGAVAIGGRARQRLRESAFQSLRIATEIAVALTALTLVVLGHLALGGRWGDELLWLLIGYTVAGAFLQRRLNVEAGLVVGLAWMSSLSWGYPVADLAAGGVLLLLWRPVIAVVSRPRPQMPMLRLAALLLSVLTVAGGLLQRQEYVYRDRPAAAMTANLDGISPAFGGINTNSVTKAYLADIVDCVQRYPAQQVAVLPDNPVIYRALGLHNPLPIDWAYPPDYAGSGDRLIASASSLNQRGDYLVLFQSFPADRLGDMTMEDYQSARAAVAADPAQRLPYSPGVLQAMRDQLHGDARACGSFIAVYAPA